MNISRMEINVVTSEYQKLEHTHSTIVKSQAVRLLVTVTEHHRYKVTNMT